jgi:hypothetical protein
MIPIENSLSASQDWIHDRNEGEALEAAIEDLIRLDRYEKRAAPRQRRAIFAFMNLKLMAQPHARPSPGAHKPSSCLAYPSADRHGAFLPRTAHY